MVVVDVDVVVVPRPAVCTHHVEFIGNDGVYVGQVVMPGAK